MTHHPQELFTQRFRRTSGSFPQQPGLYQLQYFPTYPIQFDRFGVSITCSLLKEPYSLIINQIPSPTPYKQPNNLTQFLLLTLHLPHNPITHLFIPYNLLINPFPPSLPTSISPQTPPQKSCLSSSNPQIPSSPPIPPYNTSTFHLY